MTTHYDAGNNRPPPRTNATGTARHLSGVPSQTFPLPPRSVPHQATTNSISTFFTVRDTFGPAPKRQKTDGGYVYATSAVNPQIKLENLSPPFPDKPPCKTGSAVPPTQLASKQTTCAARSPSVPPFPARPLLLPLRKPGAARSPLGTAVKEEVQTKPYALEIPRIAPRFESHISADFFPWLGTHHEDILGEVSTKNGFYDRTPATPQETTHAARSTIWSNLKHKSGLQILSSLLISVLDRRQTNGMVTAKCTFKPPPRVTLTDAKRESWLRDLASSTIPLRRLSRTIPHGIRGRSLLDHCLAKSIPVWRAVWLAKCVGANEIRAFKRKGTSGAFAAGGESKWIRDWTTNVEQFVEATIRSCGSLEWQLNVTYGLQLVKHIYSEHLLNKEHFLDWAITSFHDSDLNLLPSWFLVLQGHFDDITRQLPLGRRLVEALLKQLYKISNANVGDICDSVSTELSTSLRSLALSNPSYFLMPDSWAKYEPTLRACNNRCDKNWNLRMKQIETRNFHLTQKSGAALRESGTTFRQQFIALLDAPQSASNIRGLSRKALDMLEDRALLVCTLLEWATTQYRSGLPRIYVALRLLRLWNQRGVDLDGPVLGFLGQASVAASGDKNAIYRLIAEMIRTRLFSIGTYLQWLMARGSRSENADTDSVDAFELQLLNNIPLYGLPLHLLNLRQILLTANRNPSHDFLKTEEAVKQSLETQIAILRSGYCRSQRGGMIMDLASLSGTMKYSISRWIRDRIAASFSEINGPESEVADNDLLEASVTLADFYALRDVLETLEDFPILADVLLLLSTGDRKPPLEAIAETVNRHFEVFHAIGAAEDLFLSLLSRMKSIYARNHSDKPILLSLVDIGENFPSRGATVLKLMQEVGLCVSKAANAASSPISDTVADALQSSDSNFLEEVEAMLSYRVSLDKQTFRRIFSAVSKRLRMAWFDDAPIKWNFVELLAQLRFFNDEEFDCLMLSWLQQLLWLDARPPLVRIISPLVCARGLDLQTFIEQYITNSNSEMNIVDCARLSLDILSLFDGKSAEINKGRSQSTHRYRRELDKILRTNPGAIVTLLCRCFKSSVTDDAVIQERARALILSSFCLSLIQEVIVHYRPTIGALGRVVSMDPALHNLIYGVLDHLLYLKPCSIPQPAVTSQGIHTLLHFANDFNIGLCQLKLSIMLDVPKDHTYDSNIFREECTAVLVGEAASTFQSRPGIWLSFLSSVPQLNAEMFHARCLSTLLASMPEWPLRNSISATTLHTSDVSIDTLLASVAGIEDRLSSSSSIDSITTIIRKLCQAQSYIQLGNREVNSSRKGFDHAKREHCRPEQDDLFEWIDVLLRLLTIHQSIIRHIAFPQETLCELLLSLCLLATTSNLKANSVLLNTVLDAIAFFSNSLSPENRPNCLAVLRDRQFLHNSRLRFMFTSADDETDQLQITDLRNTSSFWVETPNCISFPFRRWEMVQDATPTVGENDTSLSLAFFGARKAVL